MKIRLLPNMENNVELYSIHTFISDKKSIYYKIYMQYDLSELKKSVSLKKTYL